MSSRATELFETLRSLDLQVGNYAVFGSGPLIVRGLIPAANDIDVVARGDAWAKASHLGEMVELPEHGIEVASFLEGAITVGTTWAYGDIDLDALIDSADLIDGLPFAKLSYVIAYKRAAARPKDVEHLRLLEQSSLLDS